MLCALKKETILTQVEVKDLRIYMRKSTTDEQSKQQTALFEIPFQNRHKMLLYCNWFFLTNAITKQCSQHWINNTHSCTTKCKRNAAFNKRMTKNPHIKYEIQANLFSFGGVFMDVWRVHSVHMVRSLEKWTRETKKKWHCRANAAGMYSRQIHQGNDEKLFVLVAAVI